MNIPMQIFESDIFGVVVDVDQSPCYLCARMRRGYSTTTRGLWAATRSPWGHHYDDVIETILMSMLYGGQVNTMMPKLHSTNFAGMELIRPLYFVKEADILAWKDYNGPAFSPVRLPVYGADCQELKARGGEGPPMWSTPPSARRSRS